MPEPALLHRAKPGPLLQLAPYVAVAVLSGGGTLAAWRLLAAPGAAGNAPASAAVMPAAALVPPAAPAAAEPPAAPGAEPRAPAAAPAAIADDPRRGEQVRYVRATLDGPLETALVSQLGRELGAPLTQVVTRALVWWVAVPGDLRRGDSLEVLFTERTGAEPLVHAVRLRSEKAARTFEAFRFQPAGSPYARAYGRDGQEVELRLRDAPLDDHEQVTSLLRDGRGHKGVDFRVPVGTPVKATFDAVLVRKNWNGRSNGNCVELAAQSGDRTAILLHLSEVAPDLHVGERVAKGHVIARSGNTGHSFAPHLHYQLQTRAGALLDPFAGGTYRRALPEADRVSFTAEVQRLDGLLARGSGLASAAVPGAAR